ncbi:MAG: SPOR domain-containing protein [Bacteroidales bacterium]|nr:SPOR domain-containing protein [Bacteroidales bacterium]
MTKEFVQYLKDAIIIKGKIQIPGLGTFRGEYQSAQIGENNKFSPPTLHLHFVEKTNKEDENIANFLVYEASLPKELATQMVRQFIQEVKNNLASNRSALIGDIGKLHFDAKQKLVFSANEKSNFYAVANGMESTSVSTLGKKSKQKKIPVKAKKTKPIKTVKPIKIGSKGEVIPKIKKMWPIWVTIILLIIAVPIVSIFMKSENQEVKFGQIISAKTQAFWSDIKSLTGSLSQSDLLANNDSTSSSENNVLIDGLDVEEKIKNDIDYEENNINKVDSLNTKLTNEQTEENTKPVEEPIVEKNKPLVDKHYALAGISGAKLNEIEITNRTELYLIVGSFSKKNNAKRLKEELISLGYQSVIIPAKGGLNRVALSKYTSVDEALKSFERFHQKKPDIGVWLLVRK